MTEIRDNTVLSKEISSAGAFSCWVIRSLLECYQLPDGKMNLMPSLLRLNYFTAPSNGSWRQVLPTFSQRCYPLSLSLSNRLGSWVPPEGTCGRPLVLLHGSPSYVTFILFGVNVGSRVPWLPAFTTSPFLCPFTAQQPMLMAAHVSPGRKQCHVSPSGDRNGCYGAAFDLGRYFSRPTHKESTVDICDSFQSCSEISVHQV